MNCGISSTRSGISLDYLFQLIQLVNVIYFGPLICLWRDDRKTGLIKYKRQKEPFKTWESGKQCDHKIKPLCVERHALEKKLIIVYLAFISQWPSVHVEYYALINQSFPRFGLSHHYQSGMSKIWVLGKEKSRLWAFENSEKSRNQLFEIPGLGFWNKPRDPARAWLSDKSQIKRLSIDSYLFEMFEIWNRKQFHFAVSLKYVLLPKQHSHGIGDGG